MNVREAVSVLTQAKKIGLVWDGMVEPLDKENALHMAAFGDFRVRGIRSFLKDEYELEINAQPVKEA